MMPNVFSLEDLSDAFWSAPAAPGMNRSHSEWAFEKFLEEISGDDALEPATSTTNIAPAPTSASAAAAETATSKSKIEEGDEEVVEIAKAKMQKTPDETQAAPVDSEQYRVFLKSQLDLACAAVALSRVSSGIASNSAVLPSNQPPASSSSHLERQRDAKGSTQASSTAPSKANTGPVGIPALPSRQKKTGVQGKQATSESSREDSDDDELEGDNGTTDNLDPAESKRARRMLSNRESARRSRRRKQEQMNELETQVSQLKVEHSTLLKRLTDMNRKCDDAAVDNRILKADIETLRAKVKMAEETVKRVTGMNPLLLAMTKVPNSSMPFVNNTVMDAPTNTAMLGQQNCNQFHQRPLPSVATAAPVHERLDGGFTNNSSAPLMRHPLNDVVRNRVVGMSQVQNAADIERVQNHIPHDDCSSGLPPVWEPGLPHVVGKK